MTTTPSILSPVDEMHARYLAGRNEGMRQVITEVVGRQMGSIARHRRALDSLSATHSMLAFEAPALPLCVDRAQGARIWDVDGNEYVDCHMAYTASVLGHNPPDVLAAVQ